MKQIIKSIAAVAVMMSFAACNNLIEQTESIIVPETTLTLRATREGLQPGTRSFRQDDGSVWWNPGEEVSVFYGSGTNGGSKFLSMNTSIAETVELNGSIQMSGSDKDFWAVYPYSEGNSCDGSSVTTVIPVLQTGVAGNFSDCVFPAIAKTKTTELAFWNICGGIKFFVSRGDIKSVTIKGNNGETLAGKVRVAFNSEGKPEVTEVLDGKTEVTLVAPGEGSFEPGKYYYVTLLPTALDGGITLTFNTSSEKGEIVSDNTQTIKRSIFGVLKDVDSKVTEWESTVVEPEWVDLGLSVKWATFNIGATKPEEYGDYFAWGETKPKNEYSWSNYAWCSGSLNSLTKYNTEAKYGVVDNKTVLDSEDDAARVFWGGNWRMPTKEEQEELINNCSWVWTTINGVSGYRVTSNKTGYTENSIFLPTAGEWMDQGFNYAGRYGRFWSCSLQAPFSISAFDLCFNPDTIWPWQSSSRYTGRTIRPVYGDFIPVSSITLNESSLNLGVGHSAQLVATIAPANASAPSVVWISDDESIASVDENGIVYAASEGITTVTAYASNSLSAACVVNVNTSVSLKDFAKEFVKGLDVWAATVGTVESEGKHLIENNTAWTDVHFIPVGHTGGPYDDHGGNQYDETLYTPWVLHVGDQVYTSAQAWEIAIRGLLDMVLADGQDYIGKMTSLNEPGYILGNNIALSEIDINTPSPFAIWGGLPWYEDEHLTYNGQYVEEVGIDLITKACLGHLVRGLIGIPGALSRLELIGNYVVFRSEEPNLILEGYSGFISPMRELILLMRFYKYLLDNSIDSNVYSAVKDVKFDYDMYHQETGGDTPGETGQSVTEILTLEKGANVTSAESLVSAVTSRGFVATDGSKAVYVYTSGSDFNGVAKVGDKVKFAGSKTVYNGVHEIEKVSALEVVSSGNSVSYPEPKDITASIASYEASEAEFITYVGTLKVSGNYFNIEVDGADASAKMGSLVYPADADAAKALDGKHLRFTGYFNGLSGSGKYVNIISTSIEEVADQGSVNITIDGNFDDWAGVPGAEPAASFKAFKVTNDADNFYFYVETDPGSRLWSGGGYLYLYFNFKNDLTQGAYGGATGMHDNKYDAYIFMYLFGGSADAPKIEDNPNGGEAKGMTMDNIVIAGNKPATSSDIVKMEIVIPRANFETKVNAGDVIAVDSYRSKDGGNVYFPGYVVK